MNPVAPVAALLFLVISLSILFTYTNGFQDGSSVTASCIACRALSKTQAIFLVTVCEFAGALFGGSAVANSIRSITCWPARADLLLVLCSGLLSAIVWNYMTKLIRVPSSSTHALVGGIFGAAVSAGHGWKYIVWGTPGAVFHATGMWRVILSLFLSPLLGFIAGYIVFRLSTLCLIRASSRVNKLLKNFQWLSVGILAFGHGANDTQKAMGILILSLDAAGVSSRDSAIPPWVRLSIGIPMALGVVSLVPGIVKRLGGIYRLRPLHGFATQLASAAVVITGSITGGPVSASQVIASTVMGVGTAERRKGVHWLIARDMLVAWFLTIPSAALLACCLYQCFFKWLGQLAGIIYSS